VRWEKWGIPETEEVGPTKPWQRTPKVGREKWNAKGSFKKNSKSTKRDVNGRWGWWVGEPSGKYEKVERRVHLETSTINGIATESWNATGR